MGKMPALRLLAVLGATAAFSLVVVPAALADSGSEYSKISCGSSVSLCTEVARSQGFNEYQYVGHDEPSLLFYSHVPGSGNQMTYHMTVPSDPAGPYSADKTYNFQLHPAFWFGMAMCATQSYPEQISTCAPDSDANAVNVRESEKHPGTAFMELQLYPPGFVKQFAGFSCAAQKWCAALTIDSYALDPIHHTQLNAACEAKVGGVEYVNFAYLTRNGKPQGPPNPLQFDFVKSGEPHGTVLYMSSGDQLTVSLHDSPDGLVTTITDNTTGQSGSMTASASNGFGQIKYAPREHGGCDLIPYTFHPMFSTSSPKTIVPWAAHTYNVAFSDEIGHFDNCTKVSVVTGACEGLEGRPGDQEPADTDDIGCSTASQSSFYPVNGCLFSNIGFDSLDYQTNAWPDGSPNHPTPILFTSPVTVGGARYAQAGFETDIPAITWKGSGGTCNIESGAGCVNPPVTDDGQQAPFYPYYSLTGDGPGGSCTWGLGASLPNTINNFGGSSTAEYGSLFYQYYYAGPDGKTLKLIQNFRRVIDNPC